MKNWIISFFCFLFAGLSFAQATCSDYVDTIGDESVIFSKKYVHPHQVPQILRGVFLNEELYWGLVDLDSQQGLWEEGWSAKKFILHGPTEYNLRKLRFFQKN